MKKWMCRKEMRASYVSDWTAGTVVVAAAAGCLVMLSLRCSAVNDTPPASERNVEM